MRVPFQLAAITVALVMLSACDVRSSEGPDIASQQACAALWGTFREKMDEARGAIGSDKIYHALVADMNLKILLNRGCCRFAETCPAYISE